MAWAYYVTDDTLDIVNLDVPEWHLFGPRHSECPVILNLRYHFQFGLLGIRCPHAEPDP